jgi:hypothetical protein
MPKSKSREPIRHIQYTHRGRTLGLVAAAAMVPAAAVVTYEISGENGVGKNQITAVSEANQIYGNVIVLKSGATYRLTPTDYGDAHNQAGTVPKGKELLIDRPLVSPSPDTNTLNEEGWIGFSQLGTNVGGIKSITDRAKVTVWANLNKLQADGYAQVYPETQPLDGTISAHVNDQGGIVINRQAPGQLTAMSYGSNSSGQTEYFNRGIAANPTAATSFIEPAGTFAQVEQG